MRVSKLLHLGMELNKAIDSGNYNDVSIADVKNKIEEGTILNFLKDRFGENLDLNIFSHEDKQMIIVVWKDLLRGVNGHRKFGVEKNGLCLLIAFIFEGVQRGLRQIEELCK